MTWLFQVWCRLVLRFYCPLHVFGQEHLPDRPYILCSNHASHLDVVALMLASGRPFKDFAMVAAQDYFFGARLQSAANLIFKLIPLERRATQALLELGAELRERTFGEGVGLLRRRVVPLVNRVRDLVALRVDRRAVAALSRRREPGGRGVAHISQIPRGRIDDPECLFLAHMHMRPICLQPAHLNRDRRAFRQGHVQIDQRPFHRLRKQELFGRAAGRFRHFLGQDTASTGHENPGEEPGRRGSSRRTDVSAPRSDGIGLLVTG